MFRWRLPDFTRMLVGQHIVNGLSVGAGVLAIAMTATALFGFVAGQPATLGAISASISDLPAPWREKARSLSVGFAFALVSTSAIQLALPWPPAALAVIGIVAFSCGMITGWGRWAVALGMQALIPVVFVLGFPRESFAAAVKIQILFAAGGFAYIAFALVATVVTDASARRLLASETIRELSIYLRAVAAAFDPEMDFEQAYGSAIRQQAALSEQLQAARALLLDHSAARLGKLAARGDDRRPSRRLRRAHRRSMRHHENSPGAAVGDAAQAHWRSIAGRGAGPPSFEVSRSWRRAGRLCRPTTSSRSTPCGMRPRWKTRPKRRTPPCATRSASRPTAFRSRSVISAGSKGRCRTTRRRRRRSGEFDLRAFLPKRAYSWTTLEQHFTIASPVLRYSVRLALAMMAGAIVAQFLGDSGTETGCC